MSNTRRWIMPGWNGLLEWQRIRGMESPFKSKKHQARDQTYLTKVKKNHRFRKGRKNSTYNLRRKVEGRREREDQALGEDCG